MTPKDVVVRTKCPALQGDNMASMFQCMLAPFWPLLLCKGSTFFFTRPTLTPFFTCWDLKEKYSQTAFPYSCRKDWVFLHVVCVPQLIWSYICLLSLDSDLLEGRSHLILLLCVPEASITVFKWCQILNACVWMNKYRSEKYKELASWLLHFRAMAYFRSEIRRNEHSSPRLLSPKISRKLRKQILFMS